MVDLETLEEINFDENWLSLPVDSRWQDTLLFVENCVNNANKKVAANIMNKIRAVINVLVNDGSTYESIVLKTALLYLLVTKTGYSISKLEEDYDKYIIEGVKALADTENPDYINNVFNNYIEYLHKIKLAEFIVDARLIQENTNLEEKTKKLALYKKVVNDYEGKTHRGLMNLLKSLI